MANPEFQNCLNQLRPSVIAAKVSGQTFDQYTQNLEPDLSVLEKLNYQPEFQTPIWDYMSGLVDQERVELGQQMLKQHAAVLRRIEAQYGVDASIVVGVWGGGNQLWQYHRQKRPRTIVGDLELFWSSPSVFSR